MRAAIPAHVPAKACLGLDPGWRQRQERVPPRNAGACPDRKGAAHALLLAAGILVAGATPGHAVERLKPEEIKTTFFTGQPFTASTPGNTKFTFVFTADGNVSRTPVGKSGAKGEGTWKLSRDGYCTTWKGSKATCFTVIPSGDNKWSVMQGTTVRATWSK
jgi:hypothetical protein